MATAGRTAAEQARIDSDEDDWHAKRRDGLGGVLTGADPEGLYKAITDDYALKPVPRSYMPAE